MLQSKSSGKDPVGYREFVLLMACMVALDAFSIDAMLPALQLISDELKVIADNQRQYVITALFLGFAFGVLFYGFIADRFGRRKPVLAGFLLYFLGSLLCIAASSFPVFLTGRVLQGLGAAGPYVLSLTIVRDLYSGRTMARTMSFILMIFITVPMIAPFVGQGLMLLAGWRSIFGALLLFSVATSIWFWARQAETLNPEDRKDFSASVISASVVEIMTNAQALKYLLALGAVTGAFIAYLSTGQQVFQDIYALGVWFPVVFASLASLFGIASWFNGRWVETMGSVRLVHYALSVVVIVSVLCWLGYLTGGALPLWSYITYMAVVMSSFAFLFGNMTSLALEPLGHIAGSASSVVSSVSTGIGVFVATIIGARLDNNVLPIILGFGMFGFIAWCLNYSQVRAQRNSDPG